MNLFNNKNDYISSPLLKRNYCNSSSFFGKSFFTSIQNKNIIVLSIIACFTMFLLFAFAKGGDYTSPALPGEGPFHYKNATAHLAMRMAETVYGNQLLASAASLVNIGGDGGTYSILYGQLQEVYNNLCIPVGYLLIVLYFSLELIEKAQADNFTAEHFIKAFIKFIVGISIMNNLYELIILGIQFSDGIAQEIADVAVESVDKDFLKTYLENLTKAGFVDALISVVELLIPSLIMLMCQLVITVSLFSRIIELFARCMFAPIGMTNIFSGGTNSSGYRYFKKIIAVGLQGALILGIIFCMNGLLVGLESMPGGYDFGTAFFGSVKQILIGLSTAMLVLKSQGWANDIMGV